MPWVTELIETATCDIEFDHVPKKDRPRFDTRTKHTYTPTRTTQDERAIRQAWRDKVGERYKHHATEVRMFISVRRPLSKSNPKYWAGRPDLGMPDTDNIDKLVRDALNGVAYKDDRQITQSRVTRLPRVPYGGKVLLRVHIQYFVEKYEK